MPELPEVETVKEVLKKNVLNQTILDVTVNYPKMIENMSSLEFINKSQEYTFLFESLYIS